MSALEMVVTRLGSSVPVSLAPVGESGPSPLPRAERAVFDRLVRENDAALEAFALRLCGSRGDAHDLVQDALERAFRRFHTFAPGTNARAWFFTILHHAFIDRCRRQDPARRAVSIDDVQVPAPEPIDPPAWTSVSSDQLAEALAALEDEFRSVYHLHAFESLSYQQISERLGIPSNTVGTRLNRARRKLRALLEASVLRKEATP